MVEESLQVTCGVARECGACQHVGEPYDVQLRAKDERVRELFADDFPQAELRPILGMRDPFHYRNKVTSPFAPGKRGPNGGRDILTGMYAAGSHRIVQTEGCLVENEQAQQIIRAIRQLCKRYKVQPYNEDRGTGFLRHAVVRMGYATRECLLTVVTNGPGLPRAEKFVKDILRNQPQVTSIVQNINERRTNAILGRECRALYGPGVMHDQLLGCSFEIGPTSFYQTNPAQTEVLYRLAIAGAGVVPGMRLLDAYCGTGTIGICAAHKCPDIEVVGVEQVAGAVAAARRNGIANGLDKRCRFVRADATEYLVAAARNGRAERFDALVMDPPRAGSTPEFLSAVCALGPERVSYVSCNVITQARDIEMLREGGYWLERVQPVDMFPHTKHVECVATLVRR